MEIKKNVFKENRGIYKGRRKASQSLIKIKQCMKKLILLSILMEYHRGNMQSFVV